jgi:hypothetical protein
MTTTSLADERDYVLSHLRRTLRTQIEITRDQLAAIKIGDRRLVELLGLEAVYNRGRIAMAVLDAKVVGLGKSAARLVRRNDRRRDGLIAMAMVAGADS